MFGFGCEAAAGRARAAAPPPTLLRRARLVHNAIMSIRVRQAAAEAQSGDSAVGASRDLVAEYLARTERLAPLFPRLHTVRARPLPADLLLNYRLAYETPQNLALELSKSILYENADSIDIKNLKSLTSHGDGSLWNGKPQQYFESMKYAEQVEPDDEAAKDKGYDVDSLAP